MSGDRDLEPAGEALLAALGEGSSQAPPAVLRERVFQATARQQPRSARARAIARPAALAAGLALVVMAAVSAAWGISANQSLAQERSLLAQLQDAAAKDEVVFDVVDARNVNKATLRSPSDESPTAPYGKVFTRPDMPYVVAMAGRLPPAPAGQEYHLYLDDVRVGTIVPNDAGFGYFVYRAGAVGIAYQRARLVLEAPQSTSASGTTVVAWPAR